MVCGSGMPCCEFSNLLLDTRFLDVICFLL